MGDHVNNPFRDLSDEMLSVMLIGLSFMSTRSLSTAGREAIKQQLEFAADEKARRTFIAYEVPTWRHPT